MEFREADFEISVVFHLMCTNTRHAAGLDSDCQPKADENWVVSLGKGFRGNIILWGMPIYDISTLEVRKLADLGLASFVRGKAARESDHL